MTAAKRWNLPQPCDHEDGVAARIESVAGTNEASDLQGAIATAKKIGERSCAK